LVEADVADPDLWTLYRDDPAQFVRSALSDWLNQRPAADWIDFSAALIVENTPDHIADDQILDTTIYVGPQGWDSAQLLLLGPILERYATEAGPDVAGRFYHTLIRAMTPWLSVYDYDEALLAEDHHSVLWSELDEDERGEYPPPFNLKTMPEYVRRPSPIQGPDRKALAQKITDPPLRALYDDVLAVYDQSRAWADTHPQYDPDPGDYDVAAEPAVIVALRQHDPVIAAYDFWSDELAAHGSRAAPMFTQSFDHRDVDAVRHAFLGVTRLFQVLDRIRQIGRRIDELAPAKPPSG
jgi:hypothetical protein